MKFIRAYITYKKFDKYCNVKLIKTSIVSTVYYNKREQNDCLSHEEIVYREVKFGKNNFFND